MYNLCARQQVIGILSPIIGKQTDIKDSTLLQLFSLINEMGKTQIYQPDSAYQKVANDFSPFNYGWCKIRYFPSPEVLTGVTAEISSFSYVDFLTHVIPDLVCDARRTVDCLQRIRPGMSFIEQTHHIITIRLLTHKMDELSAQHILSGGGYDDILDELYAAYLLLGSKAHLEKGDFLRLYSSINTFELSPNSLSPKSRGAGFEAKDLEELLVILGDELQLTRDQQIDLIAQCFVNKEQATDIIPTEQVYNFTRYKDMAERKRLVRKAHRLMAKIPPLELICAISVRKKAGKVSARKNMEALVVPNDVMLETGFIYPMFKNLIGMKQDTPILLLYPSAFFVRMLLEDEALRNRNISIVLENENVVSLLKYQIDDPTYATPFNKNKIHSAENFMKQVDGQDIPYSKIFLFCNNLPMDCQENQVVSILKEMEENKCDVFALMSSYVVENAVSLGGQMASLMPYLKTISLIPQGINNSSFPRRKMWMHFNTDNASAGETMRIYKYTLDTSTKTQAISLVREAPLEIPHGDISRLNKSICKSYSQELILRRAQGRTKTMAFAHEITPDIPVWCSQTFPKGKERNPRLEAYVAMPAPAAKVFRGFSARGEVIQSTKKHTEQVSQDNVLDWLESIYPFSIVYRRFSDQERKKLGTTLQQKPPISIREEIIEKYTPLLEKQNIALKTLWYLYPNLSNKYTGSDYRVLTEMMQTVLGQQRVCDITSEYVEKLLVEIYPDLSETALWRNYKILSIAMEKAKNLGYCQHNPLEDALREDKLRRKLFAQVRKQLVKKHLMEPELKQAYHMVVTKIQNGQYEYLGVLIRLLTGLESNIVCALRWRDMVQSTNIDVAYFVLTRQLSNDGKEISGFSDEEDYICFPLSAGLRALLENFHNRLHGAGEESQILDSVFQMTMDEPAKPYTPAQLNELTKSVLKEFNVEENYFNIAYGNNEFRKINLNKYMGDFVRENFRYWATRAAKLLPAELSFLLRNRVDSTCGRYYCDFQNEASLAIMATKLSRLECLFMQGEPPVARRETRENIDQFTREVHPGNGYRQKVSIEIRGDSKVEVIAHSPRGIQSTITKLVDKEGHEI